MREIAKKIEPGTWAVYGTGHAADIIMDELSKLNIETYVKYIVDRKKIDGGYKNYSVNLLEDVIDKIDVVLIAATVHHYTIFERVLKFLNQKKININVIDVIAYNSEKSVCDYVNYIEKSVLKMSDEFVEFNDRGYERKSCDSKIIAWYLPQFHQIEVNNNHLGQGFTEWTNTTQTIPLFIGHYQPHIPYDVGYYDLMNIDTLKRQIFLAKHYGIYGFAIHYYWFSGKRIMERPVELLLSHKELDMPFCLNWATENWTTLWDGGNKSVIYEQKLFPADYDTFWEDILPYFKDSRYIKIDNKPVFIIYRCTMFSQQVCQEFTNYLRNRAKMEGFADLYIMLANCYAPSNSGAEEWGGDAMVEYQPHMIGNNAKFVRPIGYLNPYYAGTIEELTDYINEHMYLMKHRSKTVFRSALTSWDNTARKCLTGGRLFLGLKPNTYKKWLKDIMVESKNVHSKSDDFIFVNSWNEWAEGSHLEPDMRYGYAYLEATRQAIEEVREDKNDLRD